MASTHPALLLYFGQYFGHISIITADIANMTAYLDSASQNAPSYRPTPLLIASSGNLFCIF
jgi:hypothetical protein